MVRCQQPGLPCLIWILFFDFHQSLYYRNIGNNIDLHIQEYMPDYYTNHVVGHCVTGRRCWFSSADSDVFTTYHFCAFDCLPGPFAVSDRTLWEHAWRLTSGKGILGFLTHRQFSRYRICIISGHISFAQKGAADAGCHIVMWQGIRIRSEADARAWRMAGHKLGTDYLSAKYAGGHLFNNASCRL